MLEQYAIHIKRIHEKTMKNTCYNVNKTLKVFFIKVISILKHALYYVLHYDK